MFVEMIKVNTKVSEKINWARPNRIRINALLAPSPAKLSSQVVDGRLPSRFCVELVVTTGPEACESSAPQSPDAMPVRRSRFTITEMFLDLPKCRVAMTG